MSSRFLTLCLTLTTLIKLCQSVANLELFPFVIEFGSCPSVAAQATLDKARYLGTWYEYQRFPAIFEAGLECGKAQYGDEGSKISVTNSGYGRINFFGSKIVVRESVAEGSATTPDPSKPAELAVAFGGQTSNSANYFIQETDYDNFAVVFSCSEFFGINLQFAWILTRAAGQKPSNLATIYSNLQSAGVDTSHFIKIDQSGCP